MREPISVLIPTFNREKYIGECLESIFEQTYRPIRVIVYDDGSRDGTVDIVRSFPEVQLLRGQPNRGVSFARNQLLRSCDTRYAAWQDSDDLSNKYRLEQQYDLLLSSDAALVFGYCIPLRKAGPEDWKKPPTAIRRFNTQCFAGLLFDRKRTGEVFFNERITLGGEDLLWIKTIEQKAGKRVVVPRQLYYVRRHPERIGQWKRKLENRERRRQSDEEYFQEMRKLEA